MIDKKLLGLVTAVFSLLGGFIPTLFGATGFSFVSILGGFVGGLLGNWITVTFLS